LVAQAIDGIEHSNPQTFDPLGLIVGLAEVRDLSLLTAVASAHPEYSGLQRCAAIIEQLLVAYDYTKSPVLARQIQGRSTNFASAKIRFEREPVKASRHRADFGLSLVSLPQTDRAFELLQADKHVLLYEIREIVSRWSETAA
jgi:hypothetical protein